MRGGPKSVDIVAVAPVLTVPGPLAKASGWTGMTDVALWAWLQSPHRNMPNIVLDKDQISNVTTYIISLKAEGRCKLDNSIVLSASIKPGGNKRNWS